MEIFIEIGIIICLATIVSFFFKSLKQPLIVGYILTGILVGPYLLDIVKSPEYFELFAKFGIAILLFIIGINLKPKIIKEVGRVSLITGLGQVLFTSLIGFGVMRLIGFGITESLYGAIALTFSSTIIILKLLSDKGDLGKLYGKISIGFLLVQDLFATLILLAVSIWGASSNSDKVDIFSVGFLLLKGIGVFVILYFFSKYLLPKLLHFVASSQELLFMFSITWGLGLAAIFYKFGFSLEIGALAAGIAIANSDYSQEIGSKMKPLRDFFILSAFIMLGSQMVFLNLSQIILPSLILSAFVLIGNPIIVIILMNLLGYKSRTGFLAGLTVAQISEFSLILISLGFSLGHINQNLVSMITLVGIITIAGSTYMILYANKLYDFLKPLVSLFEFNKKIHSEGEESGKNLDIVILGYDRVGYDFVKTAKNMNLNYCVIDFDPRAIEKLKENNIPYYFGDAEDVDFLDEIGADHAKIIISTIPDFDTNLKLVSYCKNHNQDGIIIVTSRNIKNAKELYKHGASFVVMSHYLGAKYASSLVQTLGFKKDAFEEEKNLHLEYLEKRAEETKEE